MASNLKQLLKLIAAKIAKGGVKSIPIAGGLLEEAIFGVLDANSSRKESAKIHYALQCLQTSQNAQTKTLDELLKMVRNQVELRDETTRTIEKIRAILSSDDGTDETVALLEKLLKRRGIDVSTIKTVDKLDSELTHQLRAEVVDRAALIKKLAGLNHAKLDMLIASLGAGYHVRDSDASRETRAAKLVEWAGREGGNGVQDVVFVARELELQEFQNAIPDSSLQNSSMPLQPALIVRYGDSQPLPLLAIVKTIEDSLTRKKLPNSKLANAVLSELRDERSVDLVSDYDPEWIIRGFAESSDFFKLVRSSAGDRDWQRDFAQVATPILVGVGRSLERSADAQALILTLCDVVSAALRLRLIWPADPDESNDIKNGIYRATLAATELDCDNVLSELKRLRVDGPD